eukprot:4565171-Pleurochrysis_carterae.AAC.2
MATIAPLECTACGGISVHGVCVPVLDRQGSVRGGKHAKGTPGASDLFIRVSATLRRQGGELVNLETVKGVRSENARKGCKDLSHRADCSKCTAAKQLQWHIAKKRLRPKYGWALRAAAHKLLRPENSWRCTDIVHGSAEHEPTFAADLVLPTTCVDADARQTFGGAGGGVHPATTGVSGEEGKRRRCLLMMGVRARACVARERDDRR